MRKFALLSVQLTACSETGLCHKHFTEEHMTEIEDRCTGEGDDDPVPGTWSDVSGNDEIHCTVCG